MRHFIHYILHAYFIVYYSVRYRNWFFRLFYSFSFKLPFILFILLYEFPIGNCFLDDFFLRPFRSSSNFQFSNYNIKTLLARHTWKIFNWESKRTLLLLIIYTMFYKRNDNINVICTLKFDTEALELVSTSFNPKKSFPWFLHSLKG